LAGETPLPGFKSVSTDVITKQVYNTTIRDNSGFPAKGNPKFESNWTVDTTDPNYWWRRRHGQIVNNSYQNVKTEIHQTVCDATFSRYQLDSNGVVVSGNDTTYYNYPAEWFSQNLLDLGVPVINTAYLGDICVSKLHARLSAAPMQLLVSLGELKQTVSLCGALLSKAAQAGKFLQKTFRSNAFRNQNRDTVMRILNNPKSLLGSGLKAGSKTLFKAAKPASKQWLQYRYGIRQLYYDYSSAAKALRSLNKPQRVRYTVNESDTDSASDEISGLAWYEMANSKSYRTATRSVFCSAGAIVRPKTNVGQIQAFGLDEIMQAAWDLTTFSFIVDWFINIGDKIAALNPSLDIEVLATWLKTTEVDLNSGYTTWDIKPATSYEVYGIQGLEIEMTKKTKTTTRVANPVMNPIPNWDINLNVGRITDLLAILRTRMFLK
jgi:hypothetical protein